MNGTQMTMRGCQYSPFLFYHHGHTWALVEENAYIRIGIDDLGQKLLGRIEEISLPGKGDQLDGGHGIRVKSRRKTISLIAPVEGNVIKINSNLSMEPLLVNISPYGSGWLALLKPINLKKTIRQLLYGTDALNWFDGIPGQVSVLAVIGFLTIGGLSLSPRVSFLNVIAGLFFSDELKVDLVPEEVRLARALEERGRELIKIGIFVLAVFVLVFFILLSNIFFKSAYLKNLDERYAPMIGESEKLEKDYARVSTIRHYLENRGYSLEVLTELHRLTPSEMALTDIRLDEQRKFSIKGTAEAMSVVFSFVDGMEKSKYFRDVKTKYTTKRRDGLKEFTDFEITAAIERGEE